jgi:hypothetical protein
MEDRLALSEGREPFIPVKQHLRAKGEND